MNRTSSPDDIERLAHRRAGAKLGWYVHALVYLVVNVALLLASQHGFGERRWAMFPVLGWGLGLTIHGAAVWLLSAGGSLRERLVQRERALLLRERQRS